MQTDVATTTMTNEGNEMTAQETPSLYDRLGGVYNIATVVDDLIDRVMLPVAVKPSLPLAMR